MSIYKRGQKYSVRIRVPKRFRGVEARTHVSIALNTCIKSEAWAKHDEIVDKLILGWEARLRGDGADEEALLNAAKDLAQSKGVRFMKADDVARLPTSEIIERVKRVKAELNLRLGAAAYLGAVKEPSISLSKALEMFFEISKDDIKSKTPDQVRRWKNPKIKIMNVMISVIGDKDIFKLDRADMLEVRNYYKS